MYKLNVGNGWAISLEGFLEEVNSSLAKVSPGGLCKADMGLGRAWPCPPFRLQMTEAALALSEQKAQDLGELLVTAEQEQRNLAQRQAKEHRLAQQVGGQGRGRTQTGRGTLWQVAHRWCPSPSHPQEAAERESKLLRDLSAANEKNLLLRNQVWGCEARPLGWVEAWARASLPRCCLSRWMNWSGR